jgi:hypothetical protein
MMSKMDHLFASSLSSEDLVADLLHAVMDVENTVSVVAVEHSPDWVVTLALERRIAV